MNDKTTPPILREQDSLQRRIDAADDEPMTEQTTTRQRYEALRLARWTVQDALGAAEHIASRACDCFEGTEEFVAFAKLREAVARLAHGSEMQAVMGTVLAARKNLTNG